MKGLFIKNMKMPERCADCPLRDFRYGTRCSNLDKVYFDKDGYPRGGYLDRPGWCPLLEVPENTRLIRIETLKNHVEKMMWKTKNTAVGLHLLFSWIDELDPAFDTDQDANKEVKDEIYN